MKTWENNKVDSINRLPGRAHFSSFPSKETALLNENKYTQAYKNLNGCWHFIFLEAPEYSPENFFATDFDTSQMDQIAVPGNWQVQGYGKMHYSDCLLYTSRIDWPKWPWENNLIKIVTKAVGLPRRDSSSSRFRLFSTNSCRRTTAHLLCLTRGDFF